MPYGKGPAGLTATNRYSMKATFYAAELLDCRRKVEG
jgi:hypothetical protein